MKFQRTRGPPEDALLEPQPAALSWGLCLAFVCVAPVLGRGVPHGRLGVALILPHGVQVQVPDDGLQRLECRLVQRVHSVGNEPSVWSDFCRWCPRAVMSALGLWKAICISEVNKPAMAKSG